VLLKVTNAEKHFTVLLVAPATPVVGSWLCESGSQINVIIA